MVESLIISFYPCNWFSTILAYCGDFDIIMKQKSTQHIYTVCLVKR